MQVTTNPPSTAPIEPTPVAESASKIKQTFTAARRRIKQIDLRQTVVDNPFAAIGIGFAVGAAVGLIRPMPKRSRIDAALTGLLTGFIFRTVKDLAIAQLGVYARDYLKQRDEQPTRDAAITPPF
jgi:hypothetical protein